MVTWHIFAVWPVLTHAHSHITRAVAAMDSCFVLVRTQQHGLAREEGLRKKKIIDPAVYCQGVCVHTFKLPGQKR